LMEPAALFLLALILPALTLCVTAPRARLAIAR